MTYVIKRTDQGGGYLTPTGSHASFTHRLENARTFATKADADAERCVENEIAVPVSSLMRNPS